MYILVIGGTQFIGPFVVRELYEKGHDITLFHRGLTETTLSSAIQHLHGNRKDLQTFHEEFRQRPPDVVLDMAPFTQDDAEQVRETFRGIARRVVAISSGDVCRAYGRVIGTEPGSPDPVPLSEDAPLREKLFPYRGERLRGTDDPSRWMDDYEKILVERVVMNTPDLPGTILRLPQVYGPGDQQHRLFPYLKRMDDHRPAILLDESIAAWLWTKSYVENVASAIVAAVLNPQAAGRIYNVGEPTTPPISAWIRQIGEAAGWTGEVAIVPKDHLPSHLALPINTEQFMLTDSAGIRKELNYTEAITLDEALRRTIAWERTHPPANIDPALFDYAAEDNVLAEQ